MLGVALAAPAARADRLAVADFRFLQAPPALHGPVEEILTQALQASGWKLVAATGRDARQPLAAVSGCIAGPCLARQARLLRADHLLTGAVEAHGSSSYDVTLSVHEPDAGAVIAQVTRRCDVCNYGDVTAAVAGAASALRAATLRALKAQGWLEIGTQPADADVFLDGAPAGRAPLRRLVGAGPHLLTAFKGGLAARQVVRVQAGSSARHTLQLAATAHEQAPAPTAQRSPALRWIGWSLVGVGAAALGAGGAVWGQASSCAGDCAQTRSAIGGGLVGGGAAALGSGALLLILERLGCRRSGASIALDAAPDALRVALTDRH